MCMGGGGGQQAPAPVPVIPPPPPPPPASPTAASVNTAKPNATQAAVAPKKRNPLRTDSYNSGASDAVATGLNIPV